MTRLESILAKNKLVKEDLHFLLSLRDPFEINTLFTKAYEVKKEHVGLVVYYRGLIELSNICCKDCYYCGIRKSNSSVERYTASKEEIISACRWAFDQGYGSVVLQSGENTSPSFINFISGLLTEIKRISDNKLGITLSLGEQSRDVYKTWRDCGAHRYLLRIETSNPDLYKTLHPSDHSFQKRLDCLKFLRELNYQVGTGVMIGLPGQTIDDLVNDILFYEKMDIDMIGMGPYIPHQQTPLSQKSAEINTDDNFMSALKMIACTRIYLKDINIAAATALQAITHDGREQGIKAGANIIMPNLTDLNYRRGYQLYDNKPCMDENASMCRECLSRRIGGMGEEIGYYRWGDSPHALKR